MHMEFVQEVPDGYPTPPDSGIHHLDEMTMAAPHDDKVRKSIWELYNHKRGQCLGLGKEQVISWNHHLLGIKPEFYGDLFQCVDRGSIHIGLACLAEAAVTYRTAETID